MLHFLFSSAHIGFAINRDEKLEMRSLRRQITALLALALLVLAFMTAAASANAPAAGGATVPSDGVGVEPDASGHGSRGPGVTIKDAGNRPITDDHGTAAYDIQDEGMTVTHDGMHVPLHEDLEDLKRGEL